MNKIIISSCIAFMLLTNANAEETNCDTVNKNVDSLSTSVTNQQELVSKLSDDIGVMADRINTMADKIVVTEKLLSDTLLTLTGNKFLIDTVVLTQPLDSSSVSKTTPPTITLSDSSATYLLYASSTATFDDGKTIAIYINSSDTLNNSWSQISNFAATNGNEAYIAVKSIKDNVISRLSNGAKLTFE